MKKETKIALTAVVALVLLFIGLNFLKGVNVFQSTNTYYVKFKDVAGLAVSNPVYANGYAVGIVRNIDFDYDKAENVLVTIELDDEMRVPEQTRAELETELMGGVKMSLILGPNPTRYIALGDTIYGGMHQGVMDKMAKLVPVVETLLPQLDSVMHNINRLTGDTALVQILHNTAAITANMNEASAQLNRMMKNDIPQTIASLKKTSANAEHITGEMSKIDMVNMAKSLDETLNSAKEFSKKLNTMTTDLNKKLSGTDNTLGLFLNDRGVYDNLNSTLKNADALMQDLKLHPKRYVHFSVFGKKEKPYEAPKVEDSKVDEPIVAPKE